MEEVEVLGVEDRGEAEEMDVEIVAVVEGQVKEEDKTMDKEIKEMETGGPI